MEDELSDLFLLNDCLISGRMSPGPPDDFLVGHDPSRDTMLLATGGQHHHNMDTTNNLLCFDNGLDYNADCPRRQPSGGGGGTVGAPFVRFSNNHKVASDAADETANFHLAFNGVKSEEEQQSNSLSPPLGRSPDHDYVHDVKEEGAEQDGVCNGYNAVSICSSSSKQTTTIAAFEYNQGQGATGDCTNDTTTKFQVQDFYADGFCDANDGRLVVSSSSSSGADGEYDTTVGRFGSVGNLRLTQAAAATEPEAESLLLETASSLRNDAWPTSPVVSPKEEAAALADDNSSTTSGDSCSNFGDYLSSSSPPGPAYHQRSIRADACASPYHQANGRYRPTANQLNVANLNLTLRNRSKMHELALKHHLISDQDPRSKGYVVLSVEERRTLIQEGLPVPSKLPLSKQEEEALKIVRRKIKNKLSAQESRRKRKEYMETLEQQIDGYQSENSSLRRRIDTLEKTNQSLLGQLKQLQQQFATSTTTTTNSHAQGLAVHSGPNRPTNDSSSTPRGATNVHHTVSLAAVFLLFAIMIPAVPIWPSELRNAFIMNSLIPPIPSANNVEGSAARGVVFAENKNILISIGPIRILSDNSQGDCEVPYSSEYFEKLYECRQDDIVGYLEFGRSDPSSTSSITAGVPAQHGEATSTVAGRTANETIDHHRIPIGESFEFSDIGKTGQVPAVACGVAVS